MITPDALSLQVFSNLFNSLAEEMGVTLQQAAHSPNIKMRRDFSCALFDQNGDLLAQAAHIPVHLGAMPEAMGVVRQLFTLRPGDVVIMNDPYSGGTHLPDISLVSAAFTSTGDRLGYLMSRAHHADVGGMSPGSMPLSREIYQEGLIIPPILLVEEGVVNDSVMQLIIRNTRTPLERRGDFLAQLAAQHAGEVRLVALAERYGTEAVTLHGAALQQYAETMMRAVITTIPQGEFTFQDVLDDDGAGTEDIPICATISRIGHDDLMIDFKGSAGPCKGSVNTVAAVTTSATLYVMQCLHRESVPFNAGTLRPLCIRLPRPSLVAAQSPSAVAAGNVETSQRIVDVLFGALAKALPDRVPAASQGTMNNLAFGGAGGRHGSAFAYYETMGGGMGGRAGSGGMHGVHDHMSNTLNTPVEVLESEYPVRVRHYGLREGTGGIGRHEGGDGLRRDLQFLEPVLVTVLADRRRHNPYGIHGGESGACGLTILTCQDTSRELPSKVSMDVLPGDIVSIQSPGGGGYGK